ncbi:MAG: HlyD family efflux transporter periplasmic adaptor subunit [Pseudomonadota bacterium]
MQAAKTVIADIEHTDPALLDPRTETEARAQLSAAESAATLARAELEKAQADLQFADSELRLARDLAQKCRISERELDAAARAFKTSRAALSVAQAGVQVRQFELERVQAQLMSPDEMSGLRSTCDCVSLKSPVDDQILQVLRELEGFVAAGESIAELSDPERLEIVVDLLSTDAVKVTPGQRAIIENWGGVGALAGRVRLVEPFGFTQVSALGIEEQRVNVIIELISPRSEWRSLGHGFQVDVRIVLWEAELALKVPLTALFPVDGAWALFMQDQGRARVRRVTIGNQSESEAEVL